MMYHPNFLMCIRHILKCNDMILDPKGDGTGGCSIYGLIDSYQSSSPDNTKASSSNMSSIKQPPDVTKSKRRFLQSHGRSLTTSPTELNQRGTVIAMEMGNVQHTIGSQFLITLSDNNGLQDLILSNEGDNETKQPTDNNSNNNVRYLSLGTVAEDTQHVLSKLNRAYCDDNGRPYADIRILRALVIHDPFDDPPGMEDLLKRRGVVLLPTTDGDNGGQKKKNDDNSTLENDFKDGYPLAPLSPTYDKPPEEAVPVRIQADDTTLFATAGWDDDNNGSREYEDEDEEEDEATRQKRLELQEKQEEEWRKKQDTSRAVMLEMLGDRPDAEIEAPENVLFVCKLNPFTNDEDLELIFSRFDQEAKAEIIRDPDTGASLQYAFVEFTNNEACNEAYLKMNNALVDDRRIKVDFSQSVANVWDRYNKRYRRGDKRSGIDRGFMDGGGRGRGRGGRGRGGRGPGRFGNHNPLNDRPRTQTSYNSTGNGQQQRNVMQTTSRHSMRQENDEFDSFGRRVQRDTNNVPQHHHHPRSNSRSPSRDNNREERRRNSRSDSGSRHERRSRRSRSRSDDSSDHSRRRKKHKHRHKDSSRRKRSRSRDGHRERKKHKKHKHDKKHSRRHDDKHHRRHHRDRSRSR